MGGLAFETHCRRRSRSPRARHSKAKNVGDIVIKQLRQPYSRTSSNVDPILDNLGHPAKACATCSKVTSDHKEAIACANWNVVHSPRANEPSRVSNWVVVPVAFAISSEAEVPGSSVPSRSKKISLTVLKRFCPIQMGYCQKLRLSAA